MIQESVQQDDITITHASNKKFKNMKQKLMKVKKNQ